MQPFVADVPKAGEESGNEAVVQRIDFYFLCSVYFTHFIHSEIRACSAMQLWQLCMMNC